MTTSALMISALCTHLLVAGLCASESPSEISAPSSSSVARITTPQPRDAVAARSHSTTLSLYQNTRRTDSFAAALITPLLNSTFAPAQTRVAQPPTANASISLLPAASRAPPSLVA